MPNTPTQHILNAALAEACQLNDVAEAQRLLSLGAQPAQDSELSLLAASKLGDDALVTLRLAQGHDANESEHSYTPLQWAAEKGHCKVIRLLVENGADLHAHCILDWEPVQIAVGEDQFEALKLLLELGADINCTDIDGWTLLRTAAEHEENQDIIFYLLEQGANAAQADLEGWSPLHCAAWNGEMDVVLKLLEYGADPNAVYVGEFGNFHDTPADLAERLNHPEVAALLRERATQHNTSHE